MESMMRPGAMKGKWWWSPAVEPALGRSMTEMLLGLGAKVCITSRKLDVLEKTAKELEAATGGDVLAVGLRCAQLRRGGAVGGRCPERFGSVDCLDQQRGRQLHQPHRTAQQQGLQDDHRHRV